MFSSLFKETGGASDSWLGFAAAGKKEEAGKPRSAPPASDPPAAHRADDAGAQRKRRAKADGPAPKKKQKGEKRTRADKAPEAELRGGTGKAPSSPPVTPGDGDGAAPAIESPAATAAQRAEDEAEKTRRTVYVGNIPLASTRKDVKRVFKQYGGVDSVRLRSVPVSLDQGMPRRSAVLGGKVNAEKRSSQSAYVVFATEAAARAALAANMSEMKDPKSEAVKHIRVDMARPTKESTGALYDTARTVFLGNLPFDVEEEQIIEWLYSDASLEEAPEVRDAIEAVRCVRDKDTNIGKGFAYVMFKHKSAVRGCLALDGARIGDRPVRVNRCVAVSDKLKNKASRQSERKGAGGRVAKDTRGQRGSRSEEPRKASDKDWMGVKVKRSKAGKPKVTRPAQAQSSPHKAHKPSKPSAEGPSQRKAHTGAGGKRPAVAARKAKKAKGAKAP
ncbi:unnamed protein product [Pedinophyceae sp. YPF-701]|nr:unnamed protein product [Pedinophyceae sp. YPF-701]